MKACVVYFGIRYTIAFLGSANARHMTVTNSYHCFFFRCPTSCSWQDVSFVIIVHISFSSNILCLLFSLFNMCLYQHVLLVSYLFCSSYSSFSTLGPSHYFQSPGFGAVILKQMSKTTRGPIYWQKSTHCGIVTSYCYIYLGQYWIRSYRVLPPCIQPLPEPMLTYHQRFSVAFTWKQFLEKYSWP